MPWRTSTARRVSPRGSVELEVQLKGVFEKAAVFSIGIKNFVLFRR
jgi:hypothetical protein